MQGQMSRKRPAPGTSPAVQQQPAVQPGLVFPPAPDTANISTDQFMNWDDGSVYNNVAPPYAEAPAYDASMYPATLDPSINATNPADLGLYSNQLVTRNKNQQLAARGRPWQDFNAGQVTPQPWENGDDEEDLEHKAMLARKDAQAKRKQIPPFVQKLSR